MGKTIMIICSLIGGMLWSESASALVSFTCTFGDNGKPCHQLKGGSCQNKFAPTVYATCGNLMDSFVCLFTKRQLSAFSDKATILKTSSDSSIGHAFAIVEPGAGNLTLGFRKYVAQCDISQTQ
jgi:hypothetical protein